MHVIEVLNWSRRLADDAHAPYQWINRPKLGQRWDELGKFRRGRVGSADSRLFSICDFVDTLLTEIERQPQEYTVVYDVPARKVTQNEPK